LSDRRNRFIKNDASALLLVAIVLLLALGIAAAMYTLRSDPVEEALSGDRVINVLYVIEKDRKPLGAYVLMYYPATKRAAIFDIPGNLGLLIRRINRVDRIDSVYTPSKVSIFENEIEDLLGIDINFSMVINTENLRRAVDLIEGVELFIPAPVDLRVEGNLVRFPSGMTRLDGDKALIYVSYETPDEEREMPMFRRQRFFTGFLKRQGEMNALLKNPMVAKYYQSCLQTGMGRHTLTRLLDEFVNIDTDRLTDIRRRGQGEWHTGVQSVEGYLREVSGQMLLIPHWDGELVKEVVDQTLQALTRADGESSGDRVYTVEVLNGTTTGGLAARTAELLRGFGYEISVDNVTNADHQSYGKTLIIDRSGQEGAADTFAEIIHCRNVRSETPVQETIEGDSPRNFEYRADFTLIIGRDFNGRYVTGN
jgi:anionic cell wall polymer biosynthesis LytR-Cps2A-Psr (LCP) family protein